MTTISQLTETMNTTIDEANDDIEQLKQCNECMADRIERNQHLIDWNKGVISHAEFTIEYAEKGKDDDDLRTRLAAALHAHTTYWMRIAIKHPDIDRGFLNKPFDELAPIDKLAPLRDADTILSIVRGE